MTKQQARIVFFAGSGVGPSPDSLTKMIVCARFEEWWKYGTNFSRAKEGRPK